MDNKIYGVAAESLKKAMAPFFPAMILLAGWVVFATGCGGGESSGENTPDQESQLVLAKARDLIESQKYEMAQFHLEKILKEHPKNVAALAAFSRVKLMTGRAKEAAEFARQALEVDPHFAEAYSILSRLSFLRARFEDSLKYARTALQTNPKLPEPYHIIGEIYLRTKRYEQGAKVLKQAVQLRPKNMTFLVTLSSAYLKLDQYETALKYARAALKIDPNNPGAHFNIAHVYYYFDDGQKALNHGRLAAKLYEELENRQWALKSQELVNMILKRFKMRPEDITG